MNLVDKYRQVHITLLDRSYNCTEGNTWVWNHVAQCLEQVNHMIGFGSGLLAIILCATSYTSLSVARARDHGHKRNIRLAAVMYWSSEVLALFGGILSLQLTTQILYSLTMVPVYSLCCTYAFVKTSSKQNQKHLRAKSKRRPFLTKCIYSIFMLLPSVLLITCNHWAVQMVNRSGEILATRIIEPEIVIPAHRLLGYIFGIMAGVLLGCVRVVEIIYVYGSYESHRCFPFVYLAGITGSGCYLYSVTSQSMSKAFLYHTSPWTIPRLITIGMDFGILVQHVLQHRRTKQRRLSDEGTRSLLSSDTDPDGSCSESEEVIWMPLKIVEAVQPQNAPNVQILTVSESSFDSQDIQRSVPDLTLVPGQASLPTADIDDEDDAGGIQRSTNEDIGVGVTKEEADNIDDSEVEFQHNDRILNHACIQDNAVSESSSSSVDSETANERSLLTVNNNCTKNSIASLGSVTAVEKIHSWISTNN